MTADPVTAPTGTKRHRLNPIERYGLRLTLIALAIVVVAIPFCYLTFDVIGTGPITRVDARVANAMNDWVHERRGLIPTLKAISWLGRPPLLAVFTIIGMAVAWRRHDRRVVIFLAVTPLGGGIVDSLVKLAVDRPRPVVDHPVTTAFGKSFPSGHAMSATVTYGALLLAFVAMVAPRFRRAVIGATLALVAAVGCSRLLLGVHFLSDVVGGYLLGFAWLIGAVAAFETWRVDEGSRPTHPLSEGVEPELAEPVDERMST